MCVQRRDSLLPEEVSKDAVSFAGEGKSGIAAWDNNREQTLSYQLGAPKKVEHAGFPGRINDVFRPFRGTQ
jgi:hypothetical protein